MESWRESSAAACGTITCVATAENRFPQTGEGERIVPIHASRFHGEARPSRRLKGSGIASVLSALEAIIQARETSLNNMHPMKLESTSTLAHTCSSNN